MNGEQMISAEWQREQQADCIVVGRHTHTHRQTHRVYVCVCVSVIVMQMGRFILRDLRIHNESQY